MLKDQQYTSTIIHLKQTDANCFLRLEVQINWMHLLSIAKSKVNGTATWLNL